MQSKLSVLQVIPNLNVSGAEQGCIDVANYLVENNYDSYVLTTAGTKIKEVEKNGTKVLFCLLYTSPSPRDATLSRMPSSA